MSVELRIVDDVLAAVADELLGALPAGRPIVLTGGSTVNAYGAAAAANPTAWSGAQLWFGDERCVPVSDPNSNFGAVRQALLDPLQDAGVELGYCKRIAGELGFIAGADAYEEELHAEGLSGPGATGFFELLLLGLGPDGHVASMFPGQASLDERSRLVVGVPEAGHEPFVPRISMTFPALSAATRVLVVAGGAGKADAVAHAFSEDAPASRDVPASLLAEYCEQVTVLLDDDSAARL
jgi:6-phosphogluconolactonase